MYDIMFGFSCEKGRLLLNNLYISTSFGVTPEQHPNDTSGFGYTFPMEKTFINGKIQPVASIKYGQIPFFPRITIGHLLRFKSEENKNEFNVWFIIDAEVDPFKLKFWSIFQPNFKYRYVEEISIDFENLEQQIGVFKKQFKKII